MAEMEFLPPPGVERGAPGGQLLVQQAWEQNNIGRMQQLLKETEQWPNRGSPSFPLPRFWLRRF